MRTAIVILNWNTRDYLDRFLPPLLDSVRSLDAGVVVADSASTDGSRELLAERFPQVHTILLEENFGFTGGYNRALAQLAADPEAPEYMVLMNSDIEVDAGWLEPLVDWMDSHADYAACGPKLHVLLPEGGDYRRTDRFEYAGAAGGRLDRYGFPYCRGRVLDRTEQDTGQYDRPADVLWVTGACMLVRTRCWRELGGLDPRFFAHMEEIDWCWRAWLAGWRVGVVPQSCVWHLGGGTLKPSSAFKLKLNFRNGLLLLENNLPATVGPARARGRIRVRKILDCCAAIVYLLSGKAAYARAVRDAHREYRQLRQEPPAHPVAASGAAPAGYSGICILLQGILRGERVFNYLRRYEDSH